MLSMICWAKMKSYGWAYPTAVLSLYGFFVSCPVSGSFTIPYLISPYKNISAEVVTNYLLPIWTYANLAFLIPIFLLSDFLRHKPLIMLQGLLMVILYILLCFAQGLPAMIIAEVSSGVVFSADVAFYSYIYTVIPVKNYQRATGYLRGATQAGSTLGASLGQILFSLAGVDYVSLHVISLATSSLAFLISFWLPMPQSSLFFKRERAAAVGSQSQQEGPQGPDSPEKPVMDEGEVGSGKEKMEHNGNVAWCSREYVVTAVYRLWQNFRESYSSRHIIYWSLWWALATAGYSQIERYSQLLWEHIEPSATSPVYNGGVEAVSSLMGAAAALSIGHIKVSWTVWGELALGLFSAISTGALFLMAFTSSIWVCSAGYVVFKTCYMFFITITTFQVASNLSMECYALIFGINTFVACSLQTILMLIVVDKAVLRLDIVTQFITYASCYTIITVLLLIRGTYTACASQHNPDHTDTKE